MAFWNSKFKYQNQLDQLEKLGYSNTKYIKDQLKKHKGDANRVISDYHKREQILRHHAESMSMSANYASSPSNKRVSPRKYKLHNNNGNDSNKAPKTTASHRNHHKHTPYTSRTQFFNEDDIHREHETTNNEEIEHKSSPQTSATFLYSIGNKQSTNPYISNSSLLPQSLFQSKTDHTPDLNQHTMEQLYDVEDIEIATDDEDSDANDDDDDDNKYGAELITHCGSTLRHENTSAIFSTTMNLLDDDKWCAQIDTVLRSNIEDALDDDLHINDVSSLYATLRATKPQSKMRIERIYNEIKWVRNDGFVEEKTGSTNQEEEDNDDKEELVSADLNDESMDDEIEKTSEYWLNSEEYAKLSTLSAQTLHPLLLNKSKHEIGLEACNESCENLFQCICMQRMECILLIYHLMKSSELWRRVPIAPLLSLKNIYGYQQIVEDFQHLQLIHVINTDRVAFDKLCTKFEKQYPCDIKKCVVFARHYRDRTNVVAAKNLYYFNNNSGMKINKTISIQNDKDMIFQQHCDKIHSYFLHSMLKFDSVGAERFDSISAIQRRNAINEHAQGRSYSVMTKEKKEKKKKEEEEEEEEDAESDEDYELYPGIEEDEEWTQQIAPIVSSESTDDNEIYSLLVEHMGIFRWQALHGFHYDEYRAADTIRATFGNIKEEVLYNDFHRITSENWNQTLRKAKAFHQSWAGRRIRTTSCGQYQDFISSIMVQWKRDEKISLREVITLKLYTDFDQLQFELKKCFRFEQFGTLVAQYNDDRKTRDLDAKKLLERRLMHFYHWRMSMQVTLKKFGRVIRGMDLYHGVNEKMILYPHATTSAFHGPLSTTASFHVAKTFATDKGMVLCISSQYPRLYHCRAFDASLLSDYPEEQEWLVGFIYTRIRKVHTKERWQIVQLPIATQLRFSFFVIHLFKLQVFSLSEDLAALLSFMLDMYLDDEVPSLSTNEAAYDHNRFWRKRMKQYYNNNNADYYCRIMHILMEKFADFARQQSIARFDDISYDLRQYFMNKVAQSVNDGRNIYRISLKKIQKIFVNVKEIYLYNYYKLDEHLLNHIVDFLQYRDNKHVIKQIKFLYYDYANDILQNEKIYCESSKLSKDLRDKLTSFGWQINEKHHRKRDTNFVYGVTIRLKNNRFFDKK